LDIDSLKEKLLSHELEDEDAIDELLLTNPAAAMEQGTALHIKKKKKGNIMSMALPHSDHDESSEERPPSRKKRLSDVREPKR
jgi:hypothetical protein